MDCGSCAREIEMAVGALEGVTTIKVSLSEGNAVVSLDPALVTEATVIEAVEDARSRGRRYSETDFLD